MVNIKTLDRTPKDIRSMVTRKSSITPFNIRGVAVNKKSGKAYNIEIQMDTEFLTSDSNVRVACSCDDFQYRWAYALFQKGALLNTKKYVLTPPNKTNPDLIMSACKHIHAFVTNELSGELKTFNPKQGKL